jgi:copper homeostasis protein (lipoprotein)
MTLHVRAIAGGLLAAVAFSGSLHAQSPAITGTVTYRERIALSPTSIVEVRLEDVTRADGTPPVVASTRIERPGQVPVRFELPYDPRAILSRGRYAVRATIRDGDVDLFASLDTALVLTQGRGSRVDLVLTRIGTAKPPEAGAAAGPGAAAGGALAGPGSTPIPVAAPLPPRPFSNFPITFTGALPCVDCESARYQLNLFEDESFFLRITYAGSSRVPKDDLGSWSLSSDRRMVAIRGMDGTSHVFHIVSPGTLRLLDAEGRPLAAGQPRDLFRSPTFRPIELRHRVVGSYVAGEDVATFVECATGQRWLVADGGAAGELTRAHAAARVPEGAAILVEFEGRVTDRDRVQAVAARSSRTVAVDAFGRLRTGESCPPRFATVPLTGTYWRLTHLGDRAIPRSSDPRLDASLTFMSEDDEPIGSFAGSTGCNRIIGTFATANAGILLTPGGMLRACAEQTVDAEQLVAVLKTVRAYRVAGDALDLLDEKGGRVARFEARAPAGIIKTR